MLSKSKSKVIKVNDYVIDLSNVLYIQKIQKSLKFIFTETILADMSFASERDADTILEKCHQIMKGE